MSQPAWLIDSSIYVFKAWHTCRTEQVDIDGNPINAVLGFMDFAYRLISNETPQLIAFAFDESLQTSHRKEIYPEYKANRTAAPDSLRLQFKQCRKFIEILGIHQAASLHYEADDLIGTWAKSLRQNDIPVIFISADKDLAQLVYEDDFWWEYNKGQKLNAKAIRKRFRVKPRQIAEQIALAGDKSDNIPGVPGVGMATAAKLLRKFDNIDHLLASTHEISKMGIRNAALIQQSVQESQETIKLASLLTKIECDIEEIDNSIFKRSRFNLEAFTRLSEQLQLTNEQKARWFKLFT